MSVTYTIAVKSSRMQAVATAIGPSGKLKLFAVDGVTLLATFILAATPATVSGITLTLSDANGAVSGILTTTASAAGTAAKASITTSADVDVLTNTLTVGTVGTDIIIDNPILALGQTVVVNSGTIQHA